MTYAPIWNRKKEILLGTKEKVNPSRTFARRAALICVKLGPAAALYFWMVERLHRDQNGTELTRFKISEAVEWFGVCEKTVDIWLRKMQKGGWITIQSRTYGGRKTYSAYYLNPINELIQDDGHRAAGRGVKAYPTRGVKAYPTKRALQPESSSPASLRHPLPEAVEQADAGRGQSPRNPAATADFITKGEGTNTALDQEMHAFLAAHRDQILNVGFKPRSTTSLVRDMREFFSGDREFWDLFIQQWPLLLAILRASFIPRSRDLGFGWLFQPNKQHPEESNFQVLICSNEYHDLKLPRVVYDPESIVNHRAHDGARPVRVLRFAGDSLTDYWVCAARLGPDEREENKYRVHVDELKALPAA